MTILKREKRIRRHGRIRAKITGTKEVPRLSVFRSNQHIFVQFIDDVAGKTILSSKVLPKAKSKIKGTKTEVSAKLGEQMAEEAKKAGITKVVFDRGGNRYHGRVKALADSLRAGGLQF